MAVAVKDAAASATKYVTRAQAAGNDYTQGVANAGQAWQQATSAASDTWAAGVAQAAQNGSFKRGVNSNTANKFQTRASTVGPARFTQGVAGAKDTWAQATQPYLNVIAAQTLTPRQPKGSPANYQRVQQIGDALRAKKQQGGS